ncbi:hypothetical protein QBC38DRAFT_143236 [Podospora fimiseda]|uniref:Protein BNI4 n=1 Tax=Podospora fimiseda TaxID=252190 RepID=A0AAN7H4S4_9PEZI|nr:hypothetical protein QBC38DRAFT_143236 [Podospora fimiseda]
MAALVQGYPQQSGTVTMLQTRPSSSSAMLPVQSGAQYVQGGPKRNSIHGLPTGAASPVVHRGGLNPVQPYAFTSTPSLNSTTQWQKVRSHRTSSSPAIPTIQTLDYLQQPVVSRPRYTASSSMTNLPSSAAISLTGAGARDDSALSASNSRRAAATPRPQQASQVNGGSAGSARVAPERYRRTALRSSDSGHQPQGTTSAQSGQDQKSMMLRSPQAMQVTRPNSFVGTVSGLIDDMGQGQAPEEAKRARRRSMPALDSAGFSVPPTPPELKRPEESSRLEPSVIAKSVAKENKNVKNGNNNTNNNLTVDKKTSPTDHRVGSSDSRSSGRSSVASSASRPSSSANRAPNVTDPTENPASPSSPSHQAGNSQDSSRVVNIPPRSSSSDAASAKRVVNPSPLSKAMGSGAENGLPVADTADAGIHNVVKTSSLRVESPAVKQLSALNEKGGRPKSKTSRLRRAFSFGSAAEFRKAVHANNNEAAENGSAKLQKDRDPDEAYNEEQERIARQQEAAGIGSNIYAGGRLFSGSTDNLSISSTASSASIMIRKMGHSMKKGGRSLVGLFRPKSVVGVPAADAKLPEAMEATVSMVTVEAERERVNVNPDPRTQPGGGTGYPRLERNSIDAASVPALEPEPRASTGTDSSARKSIVGGERERAEVLAAVRKGILKKKDRSPSPRGSDNKAAFELPGIPHVSDSPNSSAPSTPNDEKQGHRRTGTVTIGSEDYFVSALRLRQDTKSAPSTPQGSLKRNATFSPRIITFETWPSQEYDRRGEIATCNRLTPMLAQQIKEELNTFKMVRISSYNNAFPRS